MNTMDYDRCVVRGGEVTQFDEILVHHESNECRPTPYPRRIETIVEVNESQLVERFEPCPRRPSACKDKGF